MIDVFYTKETVFVLRNYLEYDNNNLYRLAHFRQRFSEKEIGQITEQLVT